MKASVAVFAILVVHACLLRSVNAQPCDSIPAKSLNCTFSPDCRYKFPTQANCTSLVSCDGNDTFLREATCAYCYQLPSTQYRCETVDSCNNPLRGRSSVTCRMNDDVLCIGNRVFSKLVDCDHSSGKKWKSAFWLSLLLGGFAADRFYLGDIGYGMFKLLTFGGFGIWVLIDFVLVASGYLQPYHGGLYEEDL